MSATKKRKWLPIALTLLAAYVVASIAGGILLAELALHPSRRRVTEDDDARAIALATAAGARYKVTSLVVADGVELRAWLLEPSAETSNSDAVMVLHGVSDSRRGVFGLADFLLRRGYTVLVPDSRAHGESGGHIATYGIHEAKDLAEWSNFLRAELTRKTADAAASAHRQPCVFAIGGSMGGAIALQTLREPSPFCAVVAESPFANFSEIAYDRAGSVLLAGDWLGRTFFRAPIEAAFLYARLRADVDLRLASPLDAVTRSTTPILLIHGDADRNNPIRHSRMLQAANPNIQLWAVPGLDHDHSASGVDGPQYQRRVLELFKRAREGPAGATAKQASQ